MALALAHTQYALQWPASPGLINLSATSNWGPPVLSGVSGETAGSFLVTFDTLDGKGIYLAATADAWESCSTTRDMFQVSADGVKWINTSAVLGGPTSCTVTPVAAGSYTYLRYAPNLWPQCAIYAIGNALPVIPFETRIAAAGHSASAAMPSPKPPASRSKRIVTPRVQGAWANGWRGVPIPPAPKEGTAAATPPMGFNR
jgi:hypothetical protein